MITRFMINCWRYGRNIPFMIIALIIWPRLCCRCDLGKMRPYRHGGRDHPTNWPGTKRWRLTPAGYTFIVKHRYGMSTHMIRSRSPILASGLRAQVRISSVYGKPHLSRVSVMRRDPFDNVPPPKAYSTTRLRVGITEDGRDFIMDLRKHPHWLIVGATDSGKSSTASAILAAVAPTNMIVILIDLKSGVSAEAYRERASAIAETQEQAVQALADTLALGRVRADLLKKYRVESVYDLPPSSRPAEVLVMIDEVAELGMESGDKISKQLATDGISNLLRNVQLLRAFGIHVIVCGQRFGSSFGSMITSIRAQLSGRVCLKINDYDTGRMAIGDLGPEAMEAVMNDDVLPGVAVVKGGPDHWQRVRFPHVSHAQLIMIGQANIDHRMLWHEVILHELNQKVTDHELVN